MTKTNNFRKPRTLFVSCVRENRVQGEQLQKAREGDTKGKSAASEHSSPLLQANPLPASNKFNKMFSYFALPYGAVVFKNKIRLCVNLLGFTVNNSINTLQ